MDKIEAETNTDEVMVQYFQTPEEQDSQLPEDEVDAEE